MAVAAQEQLQLDRVLMVVAPHPWQKAARIDMAPPAQRLEMVRAACAGFEGIEASDMEWGRAGPTYTIDTLESLHRQGVERPTLIVGADAAARMPTWHRWDDVVRASRVAVMGRDGTEMDAISFEHTVLDVNPFSVSSTLIRQRVAAGLTAEVLCPAGVPELIERYRLYRGSPLT